MRKIKHRIIVRIPESLYIQMLRDLKRPHPYADERVGFLFAKTKTLNANTSLVICNNYIPVQDDFYIQDKNVGAKINSNAIRHSMQNILDKKCGCFHVHLHPHKGNPSPSFTDQRSLPGIVQSFSNVNPDQAHGILILSEDSFYSNIQINKQKLIEPELISVVGYPMKFICPNRRSSDKTEVFSRQSFLGEHSQVLFETVRVGIIGYGGGGSHIGQQLAHIGIKNVSIFDDDKMDDTNLNRLIGAQFKDIIKKTTKVDIAKRLIKKILPDAKPICINEKWQNKPEVLQQCDIVVGCVDSYSAREQLESECRRYLIPLIDIGMDVYNENSQPYISGQVILSTPGMACMKCFGFLNEQKLTKEAAKYGNIGGRPQVVWPNGILASSAVGVLIDLITGWTNQKRENVYLSYDGNLGLLQNHARLNYFDNSSCPHFILDETGPPNFINL